VTKQETTLLVDLKQEIKEIRLWQNQFPEKYGERIIRLDERMKGVCDNIKKNTDDITQNQEEIKRKLSKKDFAWITGTITAIGGALITAFNFLKGG